MSSAIHYRSKLHESDPQSHPVLIVGQLQHLSEINFDDVAKKFGARVSEETFKKSIACLRPSPTDRCSLYMDLATVAALPLKCSRHNTESRAHALTKLLKSNLSGSVDQSVVIVCERANVLASGAAVARALPLFTRKTKQTADDYVVHVEFLLVGVDLKPLTEADIDCLQNVARGIRLAARIVDTPCSEMNVSHFVNEIELIGEELGVTVSVIRGEELKARGFGGIYGVGKAANCPPALAVLSHKPVGATETVCWVGKGIVFDTGGLSIKGKTAMPTMKLDCGGAAALLGAFYAAVKAGFVENLHAIFCLAENSVGPDSTRPDDIHTLYSGCTVEINNTDAEGRLVLSDGVAFADKDLHAKIILDMATLTGAQGIATGKYHGAVVTNSEDWEGMAVEAGRVSGDLLSALPYCPELHFSEFTSAVADMKNSVKDRNNAQPSCAALFVAANLGFDFPGVWIHVDMAYPAFVEERGTGYGVALLACLFGNYTKCALLKAAAPQGNGVEPPSKKSRH